MTTIITIIESTEFIKTGLNSRASNIDPSVSGSRINEDGTFTETIKLPDGIILEDEGDEVEGVFFLAGSSRVVFE